MYREGIEEYLMWECLEGSNFRTHSAEDTLLRCCIANPQGTPYRNWRIADLDTYLLDTRWAEWHPLSQMTRNNNLWDMGLR